MKTVLWIHATFLVFANCAPQMDVLKQRWLNFKITYNKTYETAAEESLRKEIYFKNIQKIDAHNRLYEEGMSTSRMAENEFADLRNSEFVNMMNGVPYKKREEILNTNSTFTASVYRSIPNYIDWREHGAVTQVQNQGSCRSCYAFSAIGSIEGQVFRKTGRLIPLSKQNIVDCSYEFNNHGCNGGFMSSVFEYVMANGGVSMEAFYPYENTYGYCRYNPMFSGAMVTGYKNIRSGDEASLQYAVATVGPISVAIDSSHESFRFHSEGIYYEPRCSSYNLDHAVLVVGYGSDVNGDYWLVKNSYGMHWGARGYIKMARNMNNHCGIATDASYPIVSRYF